MRHGLEALLRVAGITCALIWAEVSHAQSRLPPCPTGGVWHQCYGTYIFQNGERYDGEYREGKRNGQGTYSYLDGSRYNGEFRGDNFHGTGIFTASNGQQYIGEFRDNERNGRGALKFPSGATYVGLFRDGKFSGQGTYTFPNGERYVGEFRDGRANAALQMPPSGDRRAKSALEVGLLRNQGMRPADQASREIEEVRLALMAWRHAWSAKDVTGYIGFYIGTFQGPGDQSHEAWRRRRHRALDRPSKIELLLADIQFIRTPNPDEIEATFIQNYRSGSLHSTSRKTMTWRRTSGQWLIAKETSN